MIILHNEKNHFMKNKFAKFRKKQDIQRKEIIQKQFTHELKKPLSILNGIFNRSLLYGTEDKGNKKFDKLYNLLHNKNLLIQAYGNIEKNKGRLTAGIDFDTIDNTTITKIEKISQKIKNKAYKWSPVKRIYFEKPKIRKKGEKKKLRPIGIPTFNDRVVQESIRMILEAIYEPEFEKQGSNWGFRPNKSCLNFIEDLKFKCSGSNMAIEGDIDGAYNNVDHTILLNILAEKINDNKFLNFLKLGFKSGILEKGVFEHSLLGVPQGGIVSPLLFNIYMHKFDKYITTELAKEIEININKKEGRTYRPRNKSYNQIQTQITINRKKLIKIKNNKKWIELSKSEKNSALTFREDLKILSKKRLGLTVYETEQRLVKINYYRYADDFIIFNNAHKKHNNFIKELISKWLEENLKLKLSQEKTKITNIKTKSAKFLGFSISTYSHKKISKNAYGELTKKAGWNIVINMDLDRLFDRFRLKNFINKKLLPCSKPPWIVLRPEEIIRKYNSIIIGILNYYVPVIDRLHRLDTILYMLKFSCLSTLARKFDISITKISKKYGDPCTITINEKILRQFTINEFERSFTLLTYKYCREIGLINKIKKNYNKKNFKEDIYNNGDFFKIIKKINWRTYRNLTSACAICGTTENVQMHHVKHIKKGQVIGFTQVLNQLNRRMIPLCFKHHRDVHNGKYDNIKLNELYDIERFLF